MEDEIAATGATIAFDAIGGGKLASKILNAMGTVALRNMEAYDRYGSATYKHVYIYGALDTGPTALKRNFGFSWGIGGGMMSSGAI